MPRSRASPKPLDAAALERLALRYVERFATTRGKLTAYLTRKIRERGWTGEAADPAALAEFVAHAGSVLRRYARGAAHPGETPFDELPLGEEYRDTSTPEVQGRLQEALAANRPPNRARSFR